MLCDNMSEFAYMPSWSAQLEALAKMVLPESWQFIGPPEEQRPNYILDHYLRTIFRKQALEHR